MQEIIKKVFEQKMEDGTIEKIVSEHVDKMLHDVMRDELGWSGEVYKSLKEKLNPVLVSVVEECNVSKMYDKTLMLLNEAIKTSTYEEFADCMQAIKSFFDYNDEFTQSLSYSKEVKLSEIFAEYVKFVKDELDKSDFDEDELTEDDEGLYNGVDLESYMLVESNINYWGNYCYKIQFITTCCDRAIDKVKIDFYLSTLCDKLTMQTAFGSTSIQKIRYAPAFYLKLWAIEKKLSKVVVDDCDCFEEYYLKFEE